MHSQLSSPGMESSQSGGGWDQGTGEHQTEDGKQAQGQIQVTVGHFTEGRVTMRQVRADSDHVRLKLLEKAEVFQKMLMGLIGCSHHKASAHLISQFFQVIEAADPVGEGEFSRVEHAVKSLISGLVAEQIAVGSCLPVGSIAFPRFFSHGEGDSAFRELRFDAADDAAKTFIGEVGILTALHDKGAEAQLPALPAAGENFLFGQTVAVGMAVSTANSAVIAVIFTVIGKFNESTDVDGASIPRAAHFIGFLGEKCLHIRRFPLHEGQKLPVGQIVGLCQLFNDSFHLLHLLLFFYFPIIRGDGEPCKKKVSSYQRVNWHTFSKEDELTAKGVNMSTKRSVFSVLFLLPVFGGLVLLPEVSAQAVKEGLRLCAGVIIPALFPFLVLSSLSVSLGLTSLLGKLLAPLTGRLFQISPAGSGALVLGLIGGYPVGARAVRQLWNNGQCSYEESVHLLTFCNNCGPAFLLGVAGGAVFHSTKTGFLLWGAHLMGTMTVGLLFRSYHGRKMEVSGEKSAPNRSSVVSLPQAMTQAVQSGIQSTLSICAYVVLFRVILRLCSAVGAEKLLTMVPNGTALFGGLLELSTGMTAIDPNAAGSLPLASFLLGFGGLSVWCQTVAMVEGCGLELMPAFVGKLLHGGAAALWTVVLLRLFPQAVPTVSLPALPLSDSIVWWLPWAVNGGSWGVLAGAMLYFRRINTGKKGHPRV